MATSKQARRRRSIPGIAKVPQRLRQLNAISRRMPLTRSIEPLEDRRLLAFNNLLPQFTDPLTGERDGVWNPKQAEFSTIDPSLLRTSVEHRYSVFTGSFQPADPEVLVTGGNVIVDAYARTDSAALRADIERLGGSITGAYRNLVSALVPLRQIDALAKLDSLAWAGPAHLPVTNAGLVQSQGDASLQGDVARQLGVDGSGVKIGVISDSFNRLGGYATDVANGEFPTPVTTLVEMPPVQELDPVDEGRAMAQIIADIAPGAEIYFNTGIIGIASFVAAINNLRNAGANIIVDDLSYLSEPMFQDGAIAQAVTAAVESGVAHFSSAGNYGDDGADFHAFTDSGVEGVNGGPLHDFDSGPGVDPFQKFTLAVGQSMRLSFQWDQPFLSSPGEPAATSPGSASDVDIYVFDKSGQTAFTGGVTQNVGGDPVEIFSFFNDGTYDFDNNGVPDTEFNIGIELYFGPAPGRMKYVDFEGGMIVDEYTNQTSTSFGHYAADGVFTVAVAPYYTTPPFGVTPAILQDYSAQGRQEILFDPSGNRLAQPIIRHNVDATGVDQIDTTFFAAGPDVEPNGLPNFAGSSAAAPHVAAVAALMMDAAGGPGSLSVKSLHTGLKLTASDILQRNVNAPQAIPGAQGYDYFSGHGLVNAAAAVQGVLDGFDLIVDANDVSGDPDVNDGDPADDGVADTFVVSLDGAEVVIVINGIEAARMDLTAIDTLTINGSSDDDELVIDLSGGNPLPAGGLEFHGGLHGLAGDHVRWLGGTPLQVSHSISASDAGQTLVDGASLAFTGVELVSDLLSPAERDILLAAGAQFVTLSDGTAASDTINRLSTASTSPVFDFAAANVTTRIISGAADDQLQIEPLDALASGRIDIVLDDGDDQIFMEPQSAADLHLDGGSHASRDQLYVNAQDVGVTDTGAQLEFANFATVTYTNFEQLFISNAGAGGGLPDISVTGVFLAEGTGEDVTTMTFEITLSSANPNHSVFIDYSTLNGSAENEEGDGDYTATAGTLDFPPNTLHQTVTVEVRRDATLEPNETLKLILENAVNANLLVDEALGVIVNDDFPPAVAAYVNDDWLGLPLGADPDGSGPALSFGADAFADFPEAVAAVIAGGSIVIHPGQYHGATIGKNVSVVAAAPGVTILGASPAVAIVAGNVSMTGITLDTLSNDSTVLVTGGSLALHGMTVRETAASAQAALRVTGGTLDLGSTATPGLNTFAVHGDGVLIDNQTSASVTALGNSWLLDGVALDDFAIEDRIEHVIDEAARGLVQWVADTLFVTALPPSATDPTHNSFRRLANMAAQLDNDTTAYLQGTFDFTEPNAAADWAHGNDGLPGTADDYAVVLPGGIHGVTITAENLGDATILGPGDLPTVDLEGVFRLSSDDTHDWEISRLSIFDFDLSIDAARAGGNEDARNGLQVAGNHLRLAADWNFNVARADSFQNIGIALGPGANQTVQNNQIDIPGDEESSGSQFAAAVGIQSSPDGPTAYDGLLIEGNTINVLHAQSANPSTVIGIWDAGLAHASDITIRGNQFLNLDSGNDPRTNLQRAFRIGSQSGASTHVLYEANEVNGANLAFQWQPNTNLSGHEPIQLLGNVLENVFRGIIVSSQGAAHISGNSLTGLGDQDGIGIDVQGGSSAVIDGSLNDNSIHGFGRGIFVKGAAEITGNAATISRNNVGIDVDGGTASITGNRINDNDIGIRITDDGVVTSITNNFITDNDSDGVRIMPSAGAMGPIFNNSFTGNGDRAIRNQSGELVDASGNWWGVSTAEGVNQQEQGDIDFSPWLDSGTDIDADSSNGFQGDFSALHVDDDSPQVVARGTIQEGINWSVAGGTLTIHDGLYRESNSTVDRALSIVGESRSGVVIAPGDEDAHVDTAFGGVFQQGFIIQSSDVSIENLTIDGRANHALTPGRNNFRTGIVADRRTGVVYDRARVEDVDILHVWRRGIELFSSEAPGAVRSFDNIVRGNQIDDVTQREAILVREANSLIVGNTIRDARIGIGANDRGDLTNAPLVIIQSNELSRVNQGIALSGVANGSRVGGADNLGNTIDLTELNTADVGVFIQYAQGAVNVVGNSIQASGGDAGIWLFHNEDANRPIVVASNEVISSQSTSNSTGRGVGVFLTDDGDVFGDEDGASYATILGNTIEGFEIGVDLFRNGDSPSGGRPVRATIGDGQEANNNTLHDNDIGVRVYESDGPDDGGRLAVARILGNTASITGGLVGIEVNGGAAKIVGNRVVDNNVGVSVLNEGVALLQDNDLTDNGSIGLLIETDSVVDAGQEGLGADFTGFGVSHGGNDFSSYTGNADEDDGAIVNLNEDNVTGRQGAPPDVSARRNVFFSEAVADIEQVVFHDGDDDDLGFVDFFGLRNLVLTFDANPVDENAALTLNGTFEGPSADPHEVTIDWGDGQVDVITVPAGVDSFSTMHTYEDDDPSGTATDSYPVLVTVAETTSTVSVTDATSVTVANVAPTLSDVEVTAEVDENGEVTLTGLLGEAGPLDPLTLVIHWGDGQSETHHFAPGATDFAFTHRYLDDAPSGTSSDVFSIQLTLSDDDLGEAEHSISTTVKNVAPVLSDLAVTPSIDEGGEAHLTGTIADVGTLDSFVLHVDWGDGAIVDYPFPAGTTSFDLTHSYLDETAANGGAYAISVTLADDDLGEDADATAIIVVNVAPALLDVAITSVDENGVAHLTGAISDPGTDDAFTLTVNWGEGDPEVFLFAAGTTTFDVTHQYLDDNPSGTASDAYSVQLALSDGDGGEDQETVAATVTNVAPTAAIVGAPASGETGVPIDLTSLVSDVGTMDTLALSWEVLRNGVAYASGAGAAFSFTPTSPGSYQVTLTAADDDLGVDTDVVTINVITVSDEAPAVAQVFASSTAWTPVFLSMTGPSGFAIPSGADQWKVLPWSNVDLIRLVFTEDVQVDVNDLSIVGVNGGTYSVASFNYNALTFTATWKLTSQIGLDLVNLTLSDAVTDVDDGLALDGEWTNGTTAYPSGNTTPGGAFQFSFRVLQADTNRNGDVGIADLNYVRNNFGFPPTNIFGDRSGNGLIDIGDLNAVRNNFGSVAVPIPPQPSSAATPGSAADALFDRAGDDDGDDAWLDEQDLADTVIATTADKAPWEWSLDDGDDMIA